ncbi:MAG: hypothetical protein OXK16_05450 [bacterium]|nr:hypothetical protein [bacterium]
MGAHRGGDGASGHTHCGQAVQDGPIESHAGCYDRVDVDGTRLVRDHHGIEDHAESTAAP